MKKFQKLQILSILILIIPINIYVIGDYLGAGIQFPLVKYQISYMGSFTITILRDINYILNGTFTNKTALSVFIWFLGVIALISGIILIWIKYKDNIKNIKIAGILILLSAIFFLVSIVLQYGPFFNGPAGVAIPIGLPVLFVIGGWIYMGGYKNQEKEIEDEGFGE